MDGHDHDDRRSRSWWKKVETEPEPKPNETGAKIGIFTERIGKKVKTAKTVKSKFPKFQHQKYFK